MVFSHNFFRKCIKRNINGSEFVANKVVNNLAKYKAQRDVIIANCFDNCFGNVMEKVYTRDIIKID